jgi:pimeloyl-ACP methyl ester carboxylesterase
VNGLNIYFEEYGRGEPLVLVHGGTVAARKMWEKQIPVLSSHFRVIAPDSRGHGKTDNPAGQISYRLMADDAVGLIRALELANPLICGYSDGGQVCLEIGMNYPNAAMSLVVGAAVNHLSNDFLQSMREAGVESPGVVDLERFEKARPQLVSRLRELSAVYGPDYWKTYVTQMSKVWLTPLNYTAEDYAKITVPTLILLGDKDTGTPLEDAFEMYRLIPKAELAVLPGSDHYLVWSRPELFNNIVLDFLQRSKRS